MVKRLWPIVATLVALTGVGCGPIVGGVQIVNADIAVNAAKNAGGEKYAQYEYTMAREYLKKAREENAYSDFHGARIYAEKAIKYAELAESRAGEFSGAGVKPVLPAASGVKPVDATDSAGQPVVPPSLDELSGESTTGTDGGEAAPEKDSTP